MKYYKHKLIEEEKEIDIKFPLFKARHRRYTYAKFVLKYWEHDPNLLEAVEVFISENGFAIAPTITKKSYRISKDMLSQEFINFLDSYEHTVTEKEYTKHFKETLNLLK